MALTARFFSAVAAGAGDGTSWANRAALLDGSNNYSTVLTGFGFNSNGMEAYIQGGLTYFPAQALASGLFTNAPTIANPLFFVGCDSNGAVLPVPNPGWMSCQPAWDTSSLPNIVTVSNILTINLTNIYSYLISYSSNNRTGGAIYQADLGAQWCSFVNSTANTNAAAVGIVNAGSQWANCIFKCTGSSYNGILQASSNARVVNCRIEGVAGSSGNRQGVQQVGGVQAYSLCTIVNNGGEGFIDTSSNTGQSPQIDHCVIANNGATGIKAGSTASQLNNYFARNCMITGNTGWGIDGNSNAARFIIGDNRLRDNSSGNIQNIGNYPTDLNNYTTDSDDATEYVSVGTNGDFSIKNTAILILGKGYGVRDQPPVGYTPTVME